MQTGRKLLQLLDERVWNVYSQIINHKYKRMSLLISKKEDIR